jgi:hypothetical protein
VLKEDVIGQQNSLPSREDRVLLVCLECNIQKIPGCQFKKYLVMSQVYHTQNTWLSIILSAQAEVHAERISLR